MDTQQIQQEYDAFLLSHKTVEKSKYTHTSLIGGSYNISAADTPRFFELYGKCLEANLEVFLTEKHGPVAPILIDLDFKLGFSKKQRVYSPQDVLNICSIYAKAIRDVLPNKKDQTIAMYVLEKPWPRLTKTGHISHMKDGIHIVVPDIVTAPAQQFSIRELVIEGCQVGPLLKKWGVLNSIDEVIDEAVIERNNWLMYGSKKKDDTSRYTCTGIIDVSVDGLATPREPTETPLEMVQRLSIRNNDETRAQELQENLVKKIPFVKKPETKAVALMIIPKIEEVSREVGKDKVDKADKADKATSDEDIEYVIKLANLLDPKRMDKRNDWIEVGWCLHNIDNRLLGTWEELSSKSLSYDEGSCEREWAIARTDGKLSSIGSLKKWVEDDNPKAYKKLNAEYLKSKIGRQPKPTKKAVANTEDNVLLDSALIPADVRINDQWAAEQLVAISDGCLKSVRGEIYCFNRGLWSNEKHVFDNFLMNASKKMFFKQTGTRGEIVEYDYVGTNVKKNAMLPYLAAQCADEEFFNENSETGLGKLLFADGIFDMETGLFTEGFDKTIVFFDRINRPYKMKNELPVGLLDEVNTAIFLNVFPDEDPDEVRNHQGYQELHSTYLKIALGRAMAGGTKNTKRVNIVVGLSNSGKGTLTTAMKGAFNDFVTEFSANNFRVSSSSGEDEAKQLSWVVPIVNKRSLFANEAKTGKAYDGNVIKGLFSGGDEATIRALYGHLFNAVVQGTPFLMMNSVPDFEPFDAGLKNRIRTIEFDCAFVDKPDLELRQRKADKTIKDKLKHNADYKNAVMHLVLDAYRTFHETGIHADPPGLTEATQNNVAEGIDFKSRLLKYFDEIAPEGQDKNNYVTNKFIIKEMAKAYPNSRKLKPGDLTRCLLEIGVKDYTSCINASGNFTRGYIGIQRNGEVIERDD
jgi:Primase C terminal 2 (PriCT-2)